MIATTYIALTGLHVSGRRWFQRSAGNTYHTVRIYSEGRKLVDLPMAYGYGDHYVKTALDWLVSHDYAPADAGWYGETYLRDVLRGSCDVADVARKADL